MNTQAILNPSRDHPSSRRASTIDRSEVCHLAARAFGRLEGRRDGNYLVLLPPLARADLQTNQPASAGRHRQGWSEDRTLRKSYSFECGATEDRTQEVKEDRP